MDVISRFQKILKTFTGTGVNNKRVQRRGKEVACSTPDRMIWLLAWWRRKGQQKMDVLPCFYKASPCAAHSSDGCTSTSAAPSSLLPNQWIVCTKCLKTSQQCRQNLILWLWQNCCFRHPCVPEQRELCLATRMCWQWPCCLCCCQNTAQEGWISTLD